MRLFHNIVTFSLLFISTFLSFGLREAFASDYIDQINVDSSKEKIEKLENIFSELGIYNGSIDGKFSSIKDVIINYQVKNNIVLNENDEEAGYFGNDTIDSLKKNYGEEFLVLMDKYLKVETLKVGEYGYFEVTAYYTPLEGQSKYQRGSYYADVKLNGNGHTSSGKEAFVGVLAAPSNYDFGTKIYFEDIGVGVVEDRGGAIVNAGENGESYDRIDIWVGSGDEGRERAVKWGRRKITGYVVDEDNDVNMEFDTSKVAKYSGLRVNAETPKTENVVKLQELFKEIGLYFGEVTGEYEDIKDELISFQSENNISSYLGYFGPKTYTALANKYGGIGLFVKKEKTSTIVNNSEELSEEDKGKVEKVKDALIEIYENKYKNNEVKLSIAISNLKVELIEMTPIMKRERQKLILAYLVEIL